MWNSVFDAGGFVVVDSAVVICQMYVCCSFCEFVDVFLERMFGVEVSAACVEAVVYGIEFFSDMEDSGQGTCFDAKGYVVFFGHFYDLGGEGPIGDTEPVGDTKAMEVCDYGGVECYGTEDLLMPFVECGAVFSGI